MINFRLHRFHLHLNYLLKPATVRKKRIRKYGQCWFATRYTNKYWKNKADKLLARFSNDL